MKAKFYTNMIFELDGIGVEVHDYRGHRALRPDEIDRLHRKPLGTTRALFDKYLSSLQPEQDFNGYGSITYILKHGYFVLSSLWGEASDIKVKKLIMVDYYQSPQ